MLRFFIEVRSSSWHVSVLHKATSIFYYTLVRAPEEFVLFSLSCFSEKMFRWSCFIAAGWLHHLSISYICVRDQVWSWPIQGPCQSEAAVHTHPGAGERTPGLPAHAEPVHRRLHLRPLRRATRWASWTTEQAGQLCQYLRCWILFICTYSLTQVWLKKNPIFYIHLYPSYIFDFICLHLFSKHELFLSDTCDNIMWCMFVFKATCIDSLKGFQWCFSYYLNIWPNFFSFSYLIDCNDLSYSKW